MKTFSIATTHLSVCYKNVKFLFTNRIVFYNIVLYRVQLFIPLRTYMCPRFLGKYE